MNFNLDEATAVLSRTPSVLKAMLNGLPESWLNGNEGPETWNPYDVIGHLVHCERADWIMRARSFSNTAKRDRSIRSTASRNSRRARAKRLVNCWTSSPRCASGI